MNSIFSYVVAFDSGFAPNPFGGFLTLATCKPKIRSVAASGDWLLGLGSVRTVGSARVVFAAQVSEVIPLELYGSLSEFAKKRPGRRGSSRCGDNIYYLGGNGRFCQRENPFHPLSEMAHDLSGMNALVCNDYWYFGSSAPPLPPRLAQLYKKGRGHGRSRDARVLADLRRWIHRKEAGVHGKPWHDEVLERGCPAV